MARQRLGDRAHCQTGNALALALEDAAVNATVSGLVLNFIPEREKALVEMKRVTASGGTVAAYVWDYSGRMDLLRHFWDAAVELDPEASDLHEGERFPDANAEGLSDLFERAGSSCTATTPLDTTTHFCDFEDYWRPFLGG